MSHTFLAYIDESGDDGLNKELYRKAGSRGGQSNWLVISACIFRYSRSIEATGWRDEILAKMPRKQTRNLHFCKLNRAQKIATAEYLSQKPLRATSVLSNKQAIPDGVYTNKNQLYFYLARYLIARISWFCRDSRREVPEGDGTVKIIFSRRGGMDYLDFQSYLAWIKIAQTTEIHWPVIDIQAVEAHDHSVLAGLQLADAIASAFAAGLEINFHGEYDSKFAEILRPITYCRRKNYFSYGVKLLPKWEEMHLTEDQMRFINLFK